MRAHTITTKANTIVSGGILALGLAVVLLAATASTASAERGVTERSSGCRTRHRSLARGTARRQRRVDHSRAGPAVFDFSPAPSFGFGDRQVGTDEPGATLCPGGLQQTISFNPTISVSGDYAQTNNCPPTLSAGAFPQIQGCLITVTFAPTGTGPTHGTLSTGPGGPTMALTGKGVTTPTPWDWPRSSRCG